MADALHGLHQQDAIHLDLKPANVIVKADGTVVLVDFGFARHARYPDLLAEETRFSAGSAPYISPVQILGRRDDPRSDSSRSAACCTRWPGALFRALGAFAMFEIDLAKIE